MTKLEYEMIQDKLRKKLSHCDGLTGKRKEGYETAMREAMSIIHSFKPDEMKGIERMMLVDLRSLDPERLYVIAGGPGWTIPFGLYTCDEEGSIEGDPVPVVDAAKVVRCKDCKHFSDEYYKDYCWLHDENKSDGDFCSEGVRKNETD